SIDNHQMGDQSPSHSDYSSGVDSTNYFQQCKYIHEVELVNMKLQMRILETHLETKDRLLRNLEDIIDEQETRIANMEDFIQGRTAEYTPSTVMLHGISALSIDFGALSEENLRLKEEMRTRMRKERINDLMEADEDYESDMTSVSGEGCESARNGTNEVMTQSAIVASKARAFIDEHQISRLKRCAEELKNEKDELKRLSQDMKDAFTVCMGEVRLLLESKTVDFFKVLMERYKAEMERRKTLHNQLVELNGNIRVFYRIRPLLSTRDQAAIRIDSMDEGVVHLEHSSGRKTSRSADFVIPTRFTQNQIFDKVSPIVTSCIDGYNVCIFAYGHTGSGKTYTMEGPSSDPGINQRAILQLFESAQERGRDIEYTIKLSMIEIYNDKIRDLLSPSSSSSSSLLLRRDESGHLSIPGLEGRIVNSPTDVENVLKEGSNSRVVAATDANENSSRSHVIVRVHVHAKNNVTGMTTIGRLNLVDLAGSERVSQTNATGQLLKEAQAINKSLSELGNVVFALRQGQKHVPFRNCVLTRMLEDSLQGDSKTLVLVHIAPEEAHVCESISSINFAEKIGQVQTKVNSAFKRAESVRKSSRIPGKLDSPQTTPKKTTK
ncbi:hypothetical protein PFISCL1PPCAC_5714, partial [Pristionchus fissidentatus]